MKANLTHECKHGDHDQCDGSIPRGFDQPHDTPCDCPCHKGFTRMIE